MAGLAGDYVLCDCTAKREDHYVSRRQRQRHRQLYTRRSNMDEEPEPRIDDPIDPAERVLFERMRVRKLIWTNHPSQHTQTSQGNSLTPSAQPPSTPERRRQHLHLKGSPRATSILAGKEAEFDEAKDLVGETHGEDGSENIMDEEYSSAGDDWGFDGGGFGDVFGDEDFGFFEEETRDEEVGNDDGDQEVSPVDTAMDLDHTRATARAWNEDEEWELSRLEALSNYELSPDWEKTLHYFNWKVSCNVSDRSYNKLRDLLRADNVYVESLYKTRRYLEKQLDLYTVAYHRCIKNCTVFVGDDLLRRRCPYCRESRFHGVEGDDVGDEYFPNAEAFATLKPRAVYSYLPIIPRLKLLYANPSYAAKMRYPRSLEDDPWDDGIRDIWEGRGMLYWKQQGYFTDERTIALHFSTDGVQLFRNSTQEVWPFLLINLNLPPELRYRAEHFLPLGMSPGPAQPRNLDSFVLPLVEELNLLDKGVAAYDAQNKETFLLKAHLVLLTGDTPGVSKLLHFVGHIGKVPCRACKICGTPYKVAFNYQDGRDGEKTHYYFPLIPPTRFPPAFPLESKLKYAKLQTLPIDRLPLRSHEEYLSDGERSMEDERKSSESGVKRVSILASLGTVTIPESCPFDVMHLVFMGFVRDLCRLLNGSIFKSKELNRHSGRMSGNDWKELGVDMARIEAPVSWGRYPRNIEKYMKSFKAEELFNFLLHYLLPLTFGRVSAKTYQALERLVLAVSLSVSYEITHDEITEIEQHLEAFVKWYYETFYDNNYERLPACKYTVHCILHIAQGIRNWGSASYFWQFPQERLCGILVAEVKSRVYGSANLAVLMHQRQLMTFAAMFKFLDPVEGRPHMGEESSDSEPEERTDLAKSDNPRSFRSEHYETIFGFLPPLKSKSQKLSKVQLKHLQQHYRTEYLLDSLQDPELVNLDQNMQVWYRCQVEQTIFGCERYRRKNSTRLNHLVCTIQSVDANARYRGRQCRMIPVEFYAYVQFYCVHKFRNKAHMLMYASWRKVNIHHGLVEDMGPHCDGFQDVTALQHLCAKVTGFEGKVYFVDEPEAVKDRLRENLLGTG